MNKRYEERKSGNRHYRAFLMSFEGEPEDIDEDDCQGSSVEDKEDDLDSGSAVTMHLTTPYVPNGNVNSFDISATLANDALLYQIAPHTSKFNSLPNEAIAENFVLDRYS